METRKSKNGLKYREMIRMNGKVIKSPFFKRKTDAHKWKSKKLIERDLIRIHGEQAQESDVYFCEYANNWLEVTIKNQRSIGTYDVYKRVLDKYLMAFFKSKKLKEITLNDSDKLISELLKRGNSASRINMIIGVLKSIVISAHKNGAIFKNSLVNLKDLKTDTVEHSFLSKEDVSKILSFDSHYKTLYMTALFTGMRRGELAGLKWDRVDFFNNQILITRIRDRYGLRETTKSNKKRYIPLHPELSRLLKELHVKSKSEYVFLEKDGEPLKVQHLYRKFKNDQLNAGIKKVVRFHDLRHTFASHFMMNGGNVFELQQILGHSDIQMTMRYSHLSPDHLQTSVKFMGPKLNENLQVNPKRTPDLKIV